MVPPAHLHIPLGGFPLNTKSTAQLRALLSTASKAPGTHRHHQRQAGSHHCRAPAMTYRWRSCWVWYLLESPDHSPHLRPGWRNTITKTQPKLSSLSLLGEVQVPVCSDAFKQRNSVEGNCCRDACEHSDGTLAPAKKSGKQNQSTPASLHDSYPPAEGVTQADLPKQRQSQADIWHTGPASQKFSMGNQLQSNTAHAVIIIKNLSAC